VNALGWINLLELIIGTVAGGGFLIMYTVRFRWWGNTFGQHLFAFSGVAWLFYVFYLYITAKAIADGVPGTAPGNSGSASAIGRLVLFSLITAVIVWRFALFLRFGAQPSDNEDTRRTVRH
jgi:hypothetical protein